jgi:hypothetical protein
MFGLARYKYEPDTSALGSLFSIACLSCADAWSFLAIAAFSRWLFFTARSIVSCKVNVFTSCDFERKGDNAKAKNITATIVNEGLGDFVFI